MTVIAYTDYLPTSITRGRGIPAAATANTYAQAKVNEQRGKDLWLWGA